MKSKPNLLRVLKQTSRTFFIPISRLPPVLQDAIGSAYLCMRAIDEIEDHPSLDPKTRAFLLHRLSWVLQAEVGGSGDITEQVSLLFASYRKILPEVTLRISDWLARLPVGIAPRVWDATIAMADRMAFWAERNWEILNEADLDGYTFSVAGSVGLLLCDIWTWFDGSQIDRQAAVHSGRGLQSVNILRNRREDSCRGVDFYPPGWNDAQMCAYARKNLTLARTGITGIPQAAFRGLVQIPLLLAEATLSALETGQEKLTRNQVQALLSNLG